ncbi:hypothetical protein IFM89_004536 [Coptis chinensis]|uniref:DUF4218 domain-containing protein n=1 Tax=Coptis chinensis TaxID=261450 RepID=A0A835H499_9MAGN|nr:hypothetical protein IFM89_004536 [Coptis chinensis]
MKDLKASVRNHARPEGCMAECNLAEESVTFFSEHMKRVDINNDQPSRNEDYNDESTKSSILEEQSIFETRSIEWFKLEVKKQREYGGFKVRINSLVDMAKKVPKEGWTMQDGTPWPGNNVQDHPGMIQLTLVIDYILLKRGIFVAGLKEEIVATPEQVLDLMEFGEC